MNLFGRPTNIQQQYARRILLDIVVIPAAFYLALLVQFYGDCSAALVAQLTSFIVSLTAVHIVINAASGIYRQLWAYADLRAAWHILRASAIATLILWGGNVFFNLFPGLDNGVIIVAGLFNALLSTGIKYRRFLFPASIQDVFVAGIFTQRDPGVERALIIGANSIARRVSSRLSSHNCQAKIEVIGFIDDDPQKVGMTINGLKVLGLTAQIPELVKILAIDIVIIADENMSQEAVWQLISICQKTAAQIKVLPDVTTLMNQQYQHPLSLRGYQIEDLLQRQPSRIDNDFCSDLLQGKVILVTGAAGSIGSELCRQLCRQDPAQLLMLDNNESGLFELNLELNRGGKRPAQIVLADITDRGKMERVFLHYRPEIVFHSAAYKHVPMVEVNPDQALRVNIMGTMIVSELAHKYRVRKFVFISTDKAVKPRSVMGASKYLGELWLRALNKESESIFSVVRFGNVIGSRGSVLPVFANQIERGGPVTVTHKEMKRFFISIPEAVSLVMQAAAFGQGGDLFMLDMGEEVRIQDLAERMIRLKGLRVQKDIPIHYIGVRPGEKLSEELTYDDEQLIETPHPRVFQLRTSAKLPSIKKLEGNIQKLERYSQQNGTANHLGERILRMANHMPDHSPARSVQTSQSISEAIEGRLEGVKL